MTELVLLEGRGSIRHLVLNRPHARNAFNWELLHALAERLRMVGDDPAVRCVVIRGAGPVFSAGIDLSILPQLASAPHTLLPFRRAWTAIGALIEQMPKPVIAQIHGAVLGGAFELILACDMRVVTDTTTMRFMETLNGVVPDAGGCARLPGIVGVGRAKELILASRPITGERAAQIGLANHAVPSADLDSTVQALVDDLLACKPVAVAMAKRVIDQAARPNLAAALDQELMAQEVCFATEDFRRLADQLTESQS
ncbi:enoyl-CoA hydratase/isomerase family protein [Mycobacterium sp.]|uniref:enoyl-CoA hydratase/isomerase family protein n=1 Tax=Mycobacterium sp. TaxID=1785 RepID=UPI003BAF8164